MTTGTARLTCDATIGTAPGPYGFVPVRCTQTVATRGYWAQTATWENTGHFVAYCPIPGHRANVERRFAPLVPQPGMAEPVEPEWLHEMPEFADPVTAGKWERSRRW